MELFSANYEENTRALDDLLGVGRCFDMISRDLYVGGRRARMWVVDGYGDDAVIERMLSFWLPLRDVSGAQTMQQFINRYITFNEVNAEQNVKNTVTSVFLGKMALLVEGYDECALIDAKQYPARGVEEPSSGKVLRGAHDGFIETLVANAALLRRRIRDPQLTLEGHKVSDCSRADVVLCYLENKVDRKLLDEVRQKLAKIDVRSVSMSQESIAEAMMGKKQWWTPFPKVRARGQLARGDDPADALFRLCAGGKRLLLSAADRDVSAHPAHCGVFAHDVYHTRVVPACEGPRAHAGGA